MLKLLLLKYKVNKAHKRLLGVLGLPLNTPDIDVTLAYIAADDPQLETLYDNWRKLVLEIKRLERLQDVRFDR